MEVCRGIFVCNLSIWVWIDDSDELVHFHGKSITKFPKDLIKRTANTIEQLLDNINNAVSSLSSLDSKKSLIIVSQVVDNSRLYEMLILDTNLIWIDIVFQLADHLLDGTNLTIPVESKFLQNTFEIDNCDFVTCVCPEHLNLWTADDVSEGEGGCALLYDLNDFLSETVELMGKIHELTSW